MDWSYLQHKIPFEKNFRWRGGQVSRIEAFTDAVFAVSLTLLVVSTSVPTSYAELIGVLKTLPAFTLSFVLLVMVWYFHFIHFRRYGIEDLPTMMYNLALLFVALLYVYPLKFMFGFLQEWVTTGDIDAALAAFGLDPQAVGNLLVIYGVGFVTMYALLALMGLHALRLRDELELNEVEVVMTRSLINVYWIQIVVGTVSIILALTLPDPMQGLAGWAYMSLAVIHPAHGWLAARQEEAALRRMARDQNDEDAAAVSEETTAASDSERG